MSAHKFVVGQKVAFRPEGAQLVNRREIHDMLRLFDFPDPITHSATHMPMTTPL